jgi:hypothetical protein
MLALTIGTGDDLSVTLPKTELDCGFHVTRAGGVRPVGVAEPTGCRGSLTAPILDSTSIVLLPGSEARREGGRCVGRAFAATYRHGGSGR